MEFDDAALVRLADASTRDSMFDQDALRAVAAAAYDHPELDGPFGAVFDEVDTTVDMSAQIRFVGTVRTRVDALPYDIDVAVSGLVDAAPVVTAVWRGAVTARVRPAGEPVTSIASRWDPAGPSTVAGGLTVTFAPQADVDTEVRFLPVTAAVLVRGAGTGVGTLLRESAVIRERLVALGSEPASDPTLRRRHPIVIVWLVPGNTFDDADWPSPAGTESDAAPAARRAAASAWLAPLGIAVVPIPTS